MTSVSFSIRGVRPKPWGTKEWNWRRAIAAAASKVKSSFAGELPERLRVRLDFRLVGSAVGRADLDNLAKPVLDTLFRALHVQAPEEGLSGVCFSCDDGRVYELVLKKEAVTSEIDEGVDIAIDSI